MRLVEKKCPNCGANLSFNENDKSCKCEYCKREFEIERDTDNLDKINLIYNDISKDIGKGLKWIYIVFVIIFFLVIFFVVFTAISATSNNSSNDFPSFDSTDEGTKFLTNLDDISNFDYQFLDTTSTIAISREDTFYRYFSKRGSTKREILYLLYNDNSNKLIPIYKSVYSDGETTYNLYIPVIYDNVSSSNISHDIANAQINAPICYFNMEHTEYATGYQNLDKLYDEVIKPLEKEYTITKK